MPEFVLDPSSTEHAHAFAELDAFTQGYIEAAFFCGLSEEDETRFGGTATLADLDPETLAWFVEDCAAFQAREMAPATREVMGERAREAGRDFWYTRNAHGCGFRDSGWDDAPAAGDELYDLAKSFPECDLYVGDDGLIYITYA